MKETYNRSRFCRTVSIVALMMALLLMAGCCTTFPIPAGSARAVDAGTIDQNGNPAPPDAQCESGEKCSDPGKGCGLFSYRDVCTNVWNSETHQCSCECKAE